MKNIILTLILIILSTHFSYCQVNKQDSLALVDLYNSTDGPNWNGGNWLNGYGGVIGWNGITVENGRVTEIDLHYDLFLRWPKINGSLPESIGDLSALTKLVVNGLSGSIPASICDLKSVTELYLNGKFTGGIPENIGNLNKLNRLSLSYNLSGNIPESIGKLIALTHLSIHGNTLSGVIPESIGNLTNLQSLQLYNNDLHGEIPESIGKLTLLTSFSITGNNFSGQLPTHFEKLDLLESLKLDGAFTGEIPSSIGGMDSLKYLEIHEYEGDLTGGIPESFGNLSNLLRLYISGISGEIPESIGNLKKLNVFSIANSNLSGEIPNSIGNLTALTEFIVSRNSLSGEIPESIGNMTALTDFSVSRNNLSGEIPSTIEKLASLTNLRLNDNHFDAITKTPPNLTTLHVYNNNLDFNDLEPLAEKEVEDFRFIKQDTLILEKTIDKKVTILTMYAGGNVTTYQWFYDNEEVVDATDNTYIIPVGKEIQKYHCEAKNIHLRNLILIGKYKEKEEKDCWQVGQLTFCLNSGKWEKASGNKIKTSNIISINDFLFFDGTMTIDTTALKIEATGKYYVDNIPLAQNLGVGKFILAEGKFKLNLMGDEKKITNFLNSELSKTAMIFGTPMKIDDLQFFSRGDTVGIKLNTSVSIPLLSAGCGNPALYETNTDLALKDLEITNKGILSAGFQVDNLGFLSQGCLKNASLSYDWKKDVLIGGAEVSVSYFGDVGAGVKIEDGKLDSVAWKIDSNLKPIPVYATLGVKGFYGHFAGLNNVDKLNQQNLNKLDIKIGGIFTDFITDNFYLAEVDGRIRMDGLLETNGSLQLMQPPGDFLPYQISGTGGMKLDYASKQLGFDFNGKFGTITGDSWLGDAWGGFNVNYRDDVPKASSHFSADLSLLELPDKYPLNYLNSIISIIGTVGSRNVVCEDDPTHVYGLMYHKSDGFDLCSFNYKIDITKNWYQSGYIQFPEESRVYITIEEKSGVLAGDVSKIFTVPENNDFGIIEIKSQNSIPVSSITSPNGMKYLVSSQDDKILYTESAEKNQAFWSIFNATSGDWTITLTNPAQNDSIITHFYLKEKDFKFSMNQTGNTVTVNWDVAQVQEGQTINLLLDDDDADFNGFKITGGDATMGSLSFILDESTPKCNYYLFVQLIDEYSFIEVYAENIIENPLASLAPPTNFNSTYTSETGEVEFTWKASQLPTIHGYILSVTDEQGKDSVYAILNSNETKIALFIEDLKSKSAKIESYNFDWKIGCPNTLDLLTTSNKTDFQIAEPNDKLKIYPNPTSGKLTIRYFVPEDSKCEIRIFDIQGRQIAQPLAEFKSAGFHQLNFNYEHVPNGIYFIKLINDYQTYTVKSVFSK